MPTTDTDNIYFTDGSKPESSENESSVQASSIQAAFDNRQGHTYVWANDAERTAQVGMSQGDEGYQLDTKTQWKFDNGNWRLALPYAEFNQGSMSVAANTLTALTGLSIDSSASTATDFAVATATGITLVNPGIYSIWFRGGTSGWAANNASFIDMTLDAAGATAVIIGMAGAGIAITSVPFLRTTAMNTKLYFWVRSATALTGFIAGVKVGRVG